MLGLPHSLPCLHPAPLLCPRVSGHRIIPGTDTVGQHTTSCNTTSELRWSPHITISNHVSFDILFPPSIPLILHCSLNTSMIVCCRLGLTLDSPESRAFLEAVSTLKRLRGNGQGMVHPMGNEEEVSKKMRQEVWYLFWFVSTDDVALLFSHPPQLLALHTFSYFVLFCPFSSTQPPS